MAFEPLFQSLNSDDTAYLVPYRFANGAIIAVFAFLVPLLTMEINYFRLAVFRSWFLMEKACRMDRDERGKSGEFDGFDLGEEEASAANKNKGIATCQDECESDSSPHSASLQDATENQISATQQLQLIHHSPQNDNDDDDDTSSIDEEAISTILLDNVLSSQLCDKSILSLSSINISHTDAIHTSQRHLLTHSYSTIRKMSLLTITFWIVLYLITAVGIIVNTRGLEEKVVAIVGGASKFMASLVLFIVSAKIPQWLGVYHQGSILLVKHSSPYSQSLSQLNLNDPAHHSILQKNVRRGVGFHFAKFYVVLMPFYCGRNVASILFSMFVGALVGFLLMWLVFMVHKIYIHHRNTVAFSTIFILIAISSLTFVRGMAWIQVVWRQQIFVDGDVLLTISFFSYLVLLISVHVCFLWHTLRVEKKTRIGEGNNVGMEGVATESGEMMGDESNRSGGEGLRRRPSFVAGLPRKPSVQSHLFDPRTHFTDGNKCKFSDLSEFGSFDNADPASIVFADHQHEDGQGPVMIEMVENDTAPTTTANEVSKPNCSDSVPDAANDGSQPEEFFNETPRTVSHEKKKHCDCCELFVCYSKEYKESSLAWKAIAWMKIFIIVMAHMLFLYFVIVCIGATKQIDRTIEKLPFVHEAIYTHMNEGPVCAFDNRGPESNITTFADADAAHDAGFLILHCGACGACSSWDNLELEWSTRDTISELANDCAQRGLFGGDDAITECLMHPDIGWGASCAQCWMEDIVCTKEHCAFIFLQSQMINNVGNFAVGPNEITSATCEEANCEAGNPGHFVECSGATRRRMNITSSIARPGEQQCAIVDVKDWDDLFFGSGVV